MPDNIYGSVEDVLHLTGLRASDFSLEDDPEEEEEGKTADEKLEGMIYKWLVEIKDMIDHIKNRDYHEEGEVPPGIHGIANRVASNMGAVAILRRETPIVKNEDFSISVTDDRVFTSAIRNDLAVYPSKPRFSLKVVHS